MSMLTRNSEFHKPHADAAREAGIADGLAGIKGGGWEYAGGALEDSYQLGYLAGMAKRTAAHLPVLEIPAEVDSRLRSRVLGEVKRLAGGNEYAPFSNPALNWVNGRMQDEIGYSESTQPWAW